ncbi:SGNH/GDSL hydrolase family protein [Nakamurella endophytica]|uniref:Lipase 1 n=1 Tax=Nakamurella endophytica TaxID=1748367 RepID=A0A917WG20_9ACTN|nr:SGNH/GDSL hydrolase family protein [Nakamurella endophytica]GGL99931.1 lipase 1 [Nakamurella endophytica]
MRAVAVALWTVFAAVLALSVQALTPPPPAYVALGDSYSAGVGAGDTGDCGRSPHAFPALWAAAHPDVRFTSLACSGARTQDVLTAQIPAVPAGTTLVSLTVGGNDVGFSSVMTACALHRGNCTPAVRQAEDTVRTVLPAALDAIGAALAARAPGAKVVVVGYPEFYRTGAWWCAGIGGGTRSDINHGIALLDDALAAAATRHGWTFVDVRGAWSGHQLCSGHKWLHAADLRDLGESYHPTAAGQSQGYLPAFTAAAG